MLKDTVYQLFRETGRINYYLLYKQLEKKN